MKLSFRPRAATRAFSAYLVRTFAAPEADQDAPPLDEEIGQGKRFLRRIIRERLSEAFGS
jgi:hypothetical protein